MNVRRLLIVLVSCAALLSGADDAFAQSQGVGLTVSGPTPTPGSTPPASPGASPSATSAPSGPSTSGEIVPTTTTGTTGGTTVQGTSRTNTSQDPLPHTGMNVLRLAAIALGLITVGEVLVRATRAPRRAAAEGLSTATRAR